MKRALAGAIGLAGALAATAAAAQGAPAHRNLTTGGPLKPGFYGQIAVRGEAPPLVRPQPTLVAHPVQGPLAAPVYLYVPPGQVRRWPEHCAKWQACERPVYFVRMDDSPSRLGAWKRPQREAAAESPVLQAWSRFAQP